MQRRIKNWLIYYFARAAIALVGIIPGGWTVRSGGLLGRFAHLIAANERRLAITQISRSFSRPASKARSEKLVQGVFHQLAISSIELARLFRSPSAAPRVTIPEPSASALRQALTLNQGVVFVTGHLGNWELMAYTLARAGFPISTVAKQSYDSRFTRLLDRFRTSAGIQVIYRGNPGTSTAMLRALRKGRILGLLIDQDTSVPSVFVPFFGRPASTPVGAATIALKTNSPVVIGSIHRLVDGSHRIDIERCALPEESQAATALLTARLEDRIKRHPTQWIWFHKRWKTQPGEGTS